MSVTGREEMESDRLAKKAGSAVKGAISKSKAVKAAKLLILKAVLIIMAIMIPMIIILLVMRGILDMANAIKEGFVNNVWAGLTNMEMYDEPAMNAWNSGGDPDKTALIYQQMVSANNAGEPEYLSENGTNDVIDALSENSAWRDLMRNEHMLLGQKDMTYILQRAYDKNNEMFRMKHTQYTYDGWKLDPIPGPAGSAPLGYELKEHDDIATETSNSDDIYGNLTREHIEGEEDEHGDKIFASHWQDSFALANLYNFYNYDNWGESEENKYDPHNDGIHGNEPLEINDTDGYYITDADLRMICDLFEYNFTYYWDEIADESHDVALVDRYEFKKYKSGDYTTGYRYRRLEDPDDNGPFASPDDYYRTNQDMANPYEYYSYPDQLAYDDHTLPFTQFTPESCPNTISNTIESYKYIYTPIYPDAVSANVTPAPPPSETDPEPMPEVEIDTPSSLVHLDEAGETDYTPDPENFVPPNGDYCIGRWHVVDPREFIDTMDILAPWYKERTEGADGQKWVADSGYNWVDEMMQHYKLYLDNLPGTDEHTVSRSEYFQHLADLYNDKKIEVFYEGTKYEGMDEYFTSLENRLLHPPTDLYIAFDIDGTLDKTKSAESTETMRPGVVDAFKWMERQGIKYVIITAASDLDAKKNWLQDNLFSHMDGLGGYKGTYHVARKDRYNYCHSHGIDILVDDNPTTIQTASEHMPVIEVHCSDWSSQPSGANIYEIDDFTGFESVVESIGLGDAEDYSDWTVEFKDDEAKDSFYNYQQKPESHKYPFYSYGVTFHNKEDHHIPDPTDEDDDPGGGIPPEVPIGDPTDKVYIYGDPSRSNIVDGWFYIYGSDEPLDGGGFSYSKTEIHTMLAYLEGLSRSKTPKGRTPIDFTSATDELYEWQQSTGKDVAAILAICLTEGGYWNGHGCNYYNFFSWTVSEGETREGSSSWWNAKADCGTVSRAVVRGCEKTFEKYWGRGQNTYYKMCFNKYGYPQTREAAIAAESGWYHCYCPWWDDAYAASHNSRDAWCNKSAVNRQKLLGLIH